MKWTNSWKTHSPKLKEEELDNMNRPISTKEFELIKNNLLKQKALGPDGLITNFHQTFKEEIILILYSLFHKTLQSLLQNRRRGNTS